MLRRRAIYLFMFGKPPAVADVEMWLPHSFVSELWVKYRKEREKKRDFETQELWHSPSHDIFGCNVILLENNPGRTQVKKTRRSSKPREPPHPLPRANHVEWKQNKTQRLPQVNNFKYESLFKAKISGSKKYHRHISNDHLCVFYKQCVSWLWRYR